MFTVVQSRTIIGLCLSRSTGKWSKGTVLIHDNDECSNNMEIGYMFTPIKLRHTLCGEIVKGIKVIRASTIEMSCGNDQTDLLHEDVGNVWVQTDEYVAIKVDRRRSMQRLHDMHSTVPNPENPWKEIAALQFLGGTHPNVIKLLGAFADEESLYEVMPYCSGGSLSDYMRHHPNGTPAYMYVADILQDMILNATFFQ